MAAYAWTGFFEWYFFREDLHLYPIPIINSGLAVGILLTVSFVALVIVALRGSSRAHRVMIESAVVLVLSTPIGGLSLVRDVNIGLDKSVPWEIRAKVLGTYEQEYKDHKDRRNYAYYLEVNAPRNSTEIYLPNRIRISGLKYAELSNARFVTITIGKGFLNYSWYKKIEGHAVPN